MSHMWHVHITVQALDVQTCSKWPACLQSANSVHAAHCCPLLPSIFNKSHGMVSRHQVLETIAGVQMLVQSHLLLPVQLQKDCGLTIAQYGLLSGYASVPLSFPGCAILIILEVH